MVAEYPGSAYTANPQSTAADDPGNTVIANGADYNKHDEEIAAFSADLRAGIALQSDPALINTIAKALEMAKPIYRAIGGTESSRAFDGANPERMLIQGQLLIGQGSTEAWGQVSKPSGDGTITFDAAGKTLTHNSPIIDWTTRGFAAGMLITITGTVSNNGIKLVDDVTGNVLTLDAGETVVNEGPIATGIEAEVLKLFSAFGNGTYRAHAQYNFEIDAGALITYTITKNGTKFLAAMEPTEDVPITTRVVRDTNAYFEMVAGDWIDVRMDSDTAVTMTDPKIVLEVQRLLTNITTGL